MRRKRMRPAHLACCQEAFNEPDCGQDTMNDRIGDFAAHLLTLSRQASHRPTCCSRTRRVDGCACQLCKRSRRKCTQADVHYEAKPTGAEHITSAASLSGGKHCNGCICVVSAGTCRQPLNTQVGHIQPPQDVAVTSAARCMLDAETAPQHCWSPVGRPCRRDCHHRRMWKMVQSSKKSLRVRMSVSQSAAACAVPAVSLGCVRWVPVQHLVHILQSCRSSPRRTIMRPACITVHCDSLVNCWQP